MWLVIIAFTSSARSGHPLVREMNYASPASVKSFKLTKKKRLQAFGSEREMAKFLRRIAKEQEERQRALRRLRQQQQQLSGVSETVEVSSTAASPSQPTAGTGEDESVTNVQHAGVDEGGIVKLHGNHLVVLRRGRLFTIAVGDGSLRPVASIDAFGPDIDPSGTWYDEMLISGDTIAVIGYSYERGGTEIGLFGIDSAGVLKYRSTYHLRSNDYYSSRNYASRLIGSKLIFYTPLNLSLDGEGNNSLTLPSLRKWHKGATIGEFRRVASARRIYRPVQSIDVSDNPVLHTVTVCDLSREEFSCEATGVVGPAGRVFYVSPGSVYVWVSGETDVDEQKKNATEQSGRSMIYRLPLDGAAPSALKASGSPVDQFSFLESEDHHLNVLVRSEAEGDGMWKAEAAEGDVAFLRVPIESFSDGSEAAPRWRYRELPKPEEGDTFQNRFVGDYLLYGTGNRWDDGPEKVTHAKLYAARWANVSGTEVLTLEHGVDRIEALGADAVIIGTGGEDLHFTAVQLGARPSLAGRYVRKEASQGELRSHGFFYKREGAESGLLGLPVSIAGRPGYEHLFEGSASVLFLRNDGLRLNEIGELAARSEGGADDACRASCVDWYGNARPLFVRGRIYALLGYEIVEGELANDQIREVRRVSYAPQPASAAR